MARHAGHDASYLDMASDMTNLHPASQTVALYGADEWGSACPVLRVVGPAQAAGLQVLRGCVWSEGVLQSYSTEAVLAAGLVIVQRDFPRFQEAYAAVMAAARERGVPVL